MKYSGHRKLLCELSKVSNLMLLTFSDTKRTLRHLFLFTNSAQRELVSICTQSIRSCNYLSLHYILACGKWNMQLLDQCFYTCHEKALWSEVLYCSRWHGVHPLLYSVLISSKFTWSDVGLVFINIPACLVLPVYGDPKCFMQQN